MHNQEDNISWKELNTLVSAATFVLNLRLATSPDAIYVVPGRSEDHRIRYGVRLCNLTPECKHFLVAGSNPDHSKGGIPPAFEDTVEDLQTNFGLQLRRGLTIHLQGDTENAKTQADWLANTISKLPDVHSIWLVTAPYHLLRAYLTSLKSLINAREMKTWSLFPVPTSASPFTLVPYDQTPATDLVLGECQRILDYQAKGDVATLEELYEYLAWLYDPCDM